MPMELSASIFLILSALLAGAVSPGPSFVLVARTAMANSRRSGIATALGMGTGGVILSLLALKGLDAVLVNVPVVYTVLKVLGGIYLIYLAAGIWKGAHQALTVEQKKACDTRGLKICFIVGLFTQLSNPKTALVYAGIFAALLPAEPPYLFYTVLPPLVFLIETGWYTAVALVLSAKAPRAVYLKSKSLFDRIAGASLACLGLKLVSSAMSRWK